MTWGIIMDVDAPIEMYDAVHAEVMRTAGTGTAVDGLLVHLARPTARGFQIIEVWQTREQYERYNAELVGPITDRLSGAQALPPDAQRTEEFEVRGVVLPRGDIAF